MEIEAKFTVPSRRVYRQLARLAAVAGYALIPRGSVQVTDRYFDTRDGRLLAAGFACRLRREGEAIIATLKGLGGAEGAVHRRVEEEVRLPEWSSRPASWPESPARSLALGTAGDAPLEPLFDLTQGRARADVMDGERRVAELSLDDVQLILTALRRPVRSSFHELEVELAADGRETDLAAIAGELASTWGLSPEPRSKFERGLALLRERKAAISLSLTPEERAALQAHATAVDSPYAHRAAALLSWDAGLPLQDVMARSGLSAGRVHYWVRAFSAKRLGILRIAAHGTAKAREDTPALKPSHRPRSSAALLTVKQLCAEQGVNMAHAQATAAHAGLLFDSLKRVHKLPKKRRKLIRSAALLASIGTAIDAGRPGQAGRDLILAQPLRDVNTADRLALASIVAFCHGKVRADREPTLDALDEKLRRHVMAMAALARVAEALDFSLTQATQIETITEPAGATCEIVLDGPSAALDAERANSRADLWRQVFQQELSFKAAQLPTAGLVSGDGTTGQEQGHEPAEEAAGDAATVTVQEVQTPPQAADDPMSEAGRKVLTAHYNRMLANEAGTRLGEDPEALHDMRVATRRMRAAFALFAPHFDEKALKPLVKGLRQTGRTLGAVRDLDVLLEKARAYTASLPLESGGALDPLLAHWEAARDVARHQMLKYLDGGAYRRFVADFGAFLATPFAGALPIAEDEPVPFQVRHVVPRVIMTRYESVRAYERLLPGAALTTYHALRIECKGLRYALEFFREVLGEEAPALIKQVTAMQDLLGNLQDAHVAEGLLASFLEESKRSSKRGAAQTGTAQTSIEVPLEGVQAYLRFQRDRQAELVASFPAPWADLIGLEFRRKLALVVAAI